MEVLEERKAHLRRLSRSARIKRQRAQQVTGKNTGGQAAYLKASLKFALSSDQLK